MNYFKILEIFFMIIVLIVCGQGYVFAEQNDELHLPANTTPKFQKMEFPPSPPDNLETPGKWFSEDIKDYSGIMDRFLPYNENIEYIQMIVFPMYDQEYILRIEFIKNKTAQISFVTGYRAWDRIKIDEHLPLIKKIEIPFNVAADVKKIFVKELSKAQGSSDDFFQPSDSSRFIFSYRAPHKSELVGVKLDPRGRGRMGDLVNLGKELKNLIESNAAKHSEIIEKINQWVKKLE